MAYSIEEYEYSGGDRTFSVSFPLGYLEQSDVQVYVVGELDGFGDQVYRAYTWDDAGTVRVTDDIPTGSIVKVQRSVSKEELEIDLDNTGAVTRVTLVRGFKHLMMNIHELLDGRLDAFTGPVVDTITSLKDQAVEAWNGAIASASAAATSAANAAASESAVNTDKNAAQAAASAAATSESNAASSASTASTKAAEASTDAATATTKASEAATSASDAATARDTAQGHATTATTKAGEASTSAAAAAASAAAADTFDPANYVPKAGGSMTGALTLPASDPSVDDHAARKKYVDDQVATRLTETQADVLYAPKRRRVLFNGFNGTLRGTDGITSVTRNAVGDYTLAFSTAADNTNYGINVGTGVAGAGGVGARWNWMEDTTFRTTTACRIKIVDAIGNGYDLPYVSVEIVW